MASGDKVVVLGHYAGTSVTGAKFDSDFAAIYTMKDGKTARLQEFRDSAQINAAFPSSQEEPVEGDGNGWPASTPLDPPLHRHLHRSDYRAREAPGLRPSTRLEDVAT